MRTIEIKEVKTATGEELDYLELCNACLKTPAPGGYLAKDMKVRLAALAEFPVIPRKPGEPKLPPVVKEVTISEEVYQELKKCVVGMRWGVIDQVFPDFTDYIESVGEKKPKPAKKK